VPTGGQLSIDDSDRHRVCDLEVVDDPVTSNGETLVPEEAFDILNREETLIRIKMGIVYPDGTEELCTVGTFIIWDNIITDAGPSVRMDFQLHDLSALVSMTRVPRAKSFGSIFGGSHVQNAIALLQDAMPGIKMDVRMAIPGFVDQVSVDAGDDPWQKASSWIEAVGGEMYFDPEGVCVIRSVPDYDVLPTSWEYIDDEESQVYSLQRRVNRQDSFNAVVVTSPGARVGASGFYAVFQDTDAQYPITTTDVIRPRVVNDANVISQNQAIQLAAALMRKNGGIAEYVNLQCTPHPCFEVGDVIYVRRRASRVDARYIIDKISIPLVHDRSMNLSSRRRKVK
jgi:hypothetical protein